MHRYDARSCTQAPLPLAPQTAASIFLTCAMLCPTQLGPAGPLCQLESLLKQQPSAMASRHHRAMSQLINSKQQDSKFSGYNSMLSTLRQQQHQLGDLATFLVPTDLLSIAVTYYNAAVWRHLPST